MSAAARPPEGGALLPRGGGRASDRRAIDAGAAARPPEGGALLPRGGGRASDRRFVQQ
jgi:hypothetical protein